ncbi:hypothetical protein [Cohnella sp. AR92]|uniref:hypothetical protein n=1 Tax=Cohnella sp. AR92 TaxID=648716 RepID=UPI000F8D2738|nr:hypothetical protein [Cohnella sp. AR92]RUS48575.1 hypothetical protein ELR57_03950 [Cohnella sp. AR92]
MKKWLAIAIGATSAFAIFGTVVYSGISYLDNILNTQSVKAETKAESVEKVDRDAANNFELTRFKFELLRPESSINAQRVMYDGKETNISLLPQADRDKALTSAISTKKEAVIALGKAHLKLNEVVNSYQQGYSFNKYNVEGTWKGLDSATLAYMPDVYLHAADVVGDEKAAQDLRDVATLLTIARQKHDVQGFIYAHRIVHDLDSYVFGRPDPEEGYPKYGAARAMTYAKASLLDEIAAYIEKYEGRVG